jgi:hypothetical protein
MAIDGFRVNLGKPAEGADIRASVTKEAVSELLGRARLDPRFTTAKGDYEFRLRKHKGEAVLELRRPTTGFFAKIWGGGRRSAERTAAFDALRAQLPAMKARDADAGDMRKAEARTVAAQAVGLHAFAEAVASKTVFAGMSASNEDIRAALAAMQGAGKKDPVLAEPLVEGVDIRSQTKTLLDRANVAVDEFGRLRITSPGAEGNAAENLETIIGHVAKETGLDRADPKLKAIVEDLMTTVHSGSDRQIATLVEAETARRFDTTASSGTPERLELAFRISPTSIRVNVSLTAPVRIGDFNDPISIVSSSARLEYRLPLSALAKPGEEFDVRSAATDIDFVGGEKGDILPESADDLLDGRIREVREQAGRRVEAENSRNPDMAYAPGTVTSHQRVKAND